jgi:hypothetical protein
MIDVCCSCTSCLAPCVRKAVPKFAPRCAARAQTPRIANIAALSAAAARHLLASQVLHSISGRFWSLAPSLSPPARAKSSVLSSLRCARTTHRRHSTMSHHCQLFGRQEPFIAAPHKRSCSPASCLSCRQHLLRRQRASRPLDSSKQVRAQNAADAAPQHASCTANIEQEQREGPRQQSHQHSALATAAIRRRCSSRCHTDGAFRRKVHRTRRSMHYVTPRVAACTMSHRA